MTEPKDLHSDLAERVTNHLMDANLLRYNRQQLRDRAAADQARGTNHIVASVIKNILDQTGYEQQMTRPSVVCLCGSTRFMDAFFEAGWWYTLQGEIVLSVGVCKHADHHGAEAIGPDVAEKLDTLHLRKIDIADHVHILNVDGYVGSSTEREVRYALVNHKPISWMERGKIPGWVLEAARESRYPHPYNLRMSDDWRSLSNPVSQ